MNGLFSLWPLDGFSKISSLRGGKAVIGVSERHDERERCPLCGTPWAREGGRVHMMGGLYCVRRQLTQVKRQLQQALVREAWLRRAVEAALDILSREDIGDGAKVEGARLILKGGDRGWPTRESERARLVGEVGECCRGADPPVCRWVFGRSRT